MSYHEVLVSWDKVYKRIANGSLIDFDREVHDWLNINFGPHAYTGNRHSKAYDIQKFVESGGRWDNYIPGIGAQPEELVVAFLFRDAEDAMLFKLTWGGA